MINKATILGYLGRDPETRYTQGGDAVTNFSVATTERWKSKGGEQQEKTEWHNCVAFKRTAEVCGEYLHKGSLVYIEGKLQTRKWQDKEGHDRWSTEIIVNTMKMLPSKSDGEKRAPQNDRQQRSGQDYPPPEFADDIDDDIPF